MKPIPSTIMIVDDEPNIRLTLSTMISRAGYQVETAANGAEAISMLEHMPLALLLVDLKMPGVDGMQVVAAAREKQPDATIIVLTGHGSLETAVDGIRHGVYDYLLKTTSPSQVVERVKAGMIEFQKKVYQRGLIDTVSSAVQELRAAQIAGSNEAAATDATGDSSDTIPSEREITVGDLHIDTWRQTASMAGRPLPLTPTEFRVLLCMAEHAGKMLTYTQIVRCAQGYETSELEASELIKPHIYHLRQKLEPDPATPRYVLNVRGKGYMLQV